MAFIPQEKIDEVNRVARIEEVVAMYVELKKSGVNMVGVCPFHGGKSFNVSPSKQFYKCFGCGKSGRVINFLMDFKKISFPEAVQQLIDKYNL